MHDEQAWILKRAALTPDKTALIDIHSNREWTYHDLAIEVEKWQCLLTNCHLQKGDRVALLAENCIDAFAVLFACGLNGYIYVPLNWRLNVNELRFIVEDCVPSLLIYDNHFKDIAEQLDVMKKFALSNVDLNKDSQKIVFSSSWKQSDSWLIIYTGGTTGKSKGVVLSFDAVNWNAMNTIISWGLTADDCTLNYMPLFHTGGLNALALPLLMCGGTVVIGRRFDAEQSLQNINAYKTTISLFVPTMYQLMIETDYFKMAEFPTVKVFLSGGAPCPQTIYQRFQKRGLKFKEGYGLTEAGPNNFYISSDNAMKKYGSVGKSMQFNQVRIIDELNQDCMPNEVGELLVTGKHMFTEYWNNPTETSNVMLENWLRTGDLAKMDADGDVYIVGRKKEMIITGGENVYPQEVEQCVLQHPFVKEVAVVGVKNVRWGEVVTAFIVCNRLVEGIEEAIIMHCQKYLGRYKVPKNIYIISELPKTIVGKIDKIQLLNMF